MSILSRFRSETRGSVAIVFAIALLPILGSVGLAIDFARGAQARSVLQAALDSTALMLAKEAPKKTQAQLHAMGSAYFAALMAKETDIAAGALSVTKTDKEVKLAVNGSVQTFVAGIWGQPAWTLGIRSASAFGSKKIEVVLVLDNTGSMASQNKIGELRKASKTLVTILEGASTTPGQVKIGLVPYTTRVNLGTAYRDKAWLTNTPTGTFIAGYTRPATRSAWNGCVADRDAPHNRSTSGVSLPVPATLYPMVQCADGIAPIQPMTGDWALLRSRIDAMGANGMTNITLGAQWGFELLSGKAPFSEASSDSNVERFMILLTDGNNTQDRWGAWQQARMDGDTRAMCDAITERGTPEAAKQHRIKLYTVLVIDGNETLLRNCASSPANYYKVNQASQLETVFKKIAEDIGTIRLTM